MTGPAVLGIDGGGTSTTAWLADDRGNVLGRGRAGPSNIKAVGADVALNSLNAAISHAFTDSRQPPGPVQVACLGLAGFDRPDDKRLLGQWAIENQWAHRLVLVNDGDLVIAAGTPDGWGVGVIAGTGSIAVGRARDGSTTRAGGWGHLLGDEGSAYAVSLAALRCIVRGADGRDPPGMGKRLAAHLCPAMGISEPSELVSAVYDPDFDRARIAALAPLIVAAAHDDPRIEDVLLRPAAAQLAEMVLTVARRIGWSSGKGEGHLPLAMAGSFLLGTPVVARGLVEGLERHGCLVSATPVAEPAVGAVVLARKAFLS